MTKQQWRELPANRRILHILEKTEDVVVFCRKKLERGEPLMSIEFTLLEVIDCAQALRNTLDYITLTCPPDLKVGNE